MKKKIVFLHPDLGIGGAERLVVDAALALKSRGHSVHFVTNHHDPNHCFEETTNGQLNVTPMTHASPLLKLIIMLMGKNDYFSTDKEISEFMDKVSAEEKKLKYFDSGHILPNEYKIDAIKWIMEYNN